MAYTLAPLERLSEQLERLPGIGRRSAARLAFHLLYMKQADADALTEALRTARESIHECPICCDLTDGEICRSAPIKSATPPRSASWPGRRT